MTTQLPSKETKDSAGIAQSPAAESGAMGERRRVLGESIRSLWEGRGKTERDIIHFTKISSPFIQAVVEGRFDDLPGKVFVRGFIKNVSKLLAVDSQPLLDELDQCWEGPAPKVRKGSYRLEPRSTAPRPATPKPNPGNISLPPKGVMLFAGAIIAFFAFIFALKSSMTSAPSEMSENVVETVTPAEEVNAEAVEAAASAPKDGDESAAAQAPLSVPAAAVAPVEAANGLNTEPSPTASAPLAAVPAPSIPQAAEQEMRPLRLVATDKTSYLLLKVKEVTTLRYRLDQDSYQTKDLAAGVYRFVFKDRGDFYIGHPDRVELSFNGRAFGALDAAMGNKRLTFVAQKLSDQKASLE